MVQKVYPVRSPSKGKSFADKIQKEESELGKWSQIVGNCLIKKSIFVVCRSRPFSNGLKAQPSTAFCHCRVVRARRNQRQRSWTWCVVGTESWADTQQADLRACAATHNSDCFKQFATSEYLCWPLVKREICVEWNFHGSRIHLYEVARWAHWKLKSLP